MSSDEAPHPLAESGVTIRSDSEQYSGCEDISTSPPSSSSPAIVLYQAPTFWSILRGATINLFLPFVNGMMLGFGELFAHEAAFRLGWSGTRVFPLSRRQAHPIGPGIEVTATARRIGGPLAAIAASQQLFSSRQARFASTQPNPIEPLGAPNVNATPIDLNNFDVTKTNVDLNGLDLLNVPETIGFLKTLGLDYGWGPTSMMQWCLEHIYVYTGLPWWASMGVLALGLRVVIFKQSLEATAMGQKLQDARKNPRYEAALAKARDATDTTAAMVARQEIMQIHKAVGFKMWKTLIPFINIPISYGVFRLFRGMAALPVPSLLDGGMLWFQDLSIADPLYILPVLTSVVMLQSIRISWPYMAPTQQRTMKAMSFVIIPVGVLATLWIPSGLQFYFLLTAGLQWLQSAAFYNHTLRRMLGLPPLYIGGVAPEGPKPMPGTWQAPRTLNTTATIVEEKKDDSMFSAIREGLGAAKEKISEYGDKNQAKTAVRNSRELDEKRALQEKEELLARRERKLMKRREGK
ncbi:outer membrane protein TOM13-domain-containing protein [Immersiella caudata]|uniref:Outer membrane protein TOM13-domain-containing protein n=1 Tax=Immersiella caudata TaxID=314043 RepID=A0AA39WQC6_9PEZI|nr:outer membrane protein TOM13-domain-containing protein [Immersiella caudata]